MMTRKGPQNWKFSQILSGITLGSFLLSTPASLLAASLDNLRGEKSNLQGNIRGLEHDAHEARQEVRTLEAAIAFLDRSIATLQAQIQATENEIAETTAAIEEKERELAQKKSEQDESIRVMYELQAGDTMMESLLNNENLSEATNRVEYIDALQAKIAQIMEELARLKAELEAKKTNLENLRSQQVDQKKQLQAQQAQKIRLFNNATAELNKINRQLHANRVKVSNIEAEIAAQVAALYKARSSVGAAVSGTGRRVSLGTVIGYEGSTGYSTGPHLHFECIKNGNPVNPRTCLPPLSWPLDDYFVSQEFGKPNWDAAYDWHTGIDLVAPYGAPIKAACAGEIILDQWYGGYGNAVVIDCGGGTWTLYGHMIN